MCIYSQLKKIQTNFVQPPPPPQGVNGTPYVPKLYASSEKRSQNVLKVEAWN